MREATSEPYDPRVYFSNILLFDLLFCNLCFQIYKTKTQKHIAAYLLFLFCVLERSISPIYHYLIYLFTVERLTTSLSRRVASICCLCAGAAYWVVVILLLV